MLDTRLLDRLASGRKEESYWPVAVANEKFHCIILKGGDQYPYFPRPLLSEFDFRMPLASPENEKNKKDADDMADDDEEGQDTRTATQRLESAYMLLALQTNLLADALNHRGTSELRSTVARNELEVDKTLLQLLAQECITSEETGMKALEIVKLMHDRSGKMTEASAKVARRYERWGLEERIRAYAEAKLRGEEDDLDGDL